MTLKALLVAAGAASLIAGAAYAQDSTTDVTTHTHDDGTVSTDVTTTTTIVTPGAADPTVTTSANSAVSMGLPASATVTTTGVPGTVTTRVVTNGPVPDTAENRARYGQPLSRAGKASTPAGN
ncbi:MAG TPA: hypothetical protein VD906_00540 [Caulobacteraceae bacterium]|nr:hypothetical protein [Caulobacteraceae bacterium]